LMRALALDDASILCIIYAKIEQEADVREEDANALRLSSRKDHAMSNPHSSYEDYVEREFKQIEIWEPIGVKSLDATVLSVITVSMPPWPPITELCTMVWVSHDGKDDALQHRERPASN